MPSSTISRKVCLPVPSSTGIQICDALDAADTRPRSVSDWFSLQASKTPAQIAVVQGDLHLTYAELETKSSQLASWLLAGGVQRGMVVGILTTRSLNFVVAALGTWKAGGAYLPLDPHLPSACVRALLNDAQVPILLAEDKLKNESYEENRYVMILDRDSHPLNARPQTAPEQDSATAVSESVAYVIYTSGSTGTPKGVEVSHRNLLNLIEWHQSVFKVTQADRATQLASLSFDAAVWEIWPYLTAGASVHLVPEGIRTSPDRLRDWLVENAITIGFVPTMLAESLMVLDWPAKTALRIMLTGADVLHTYPSMKLPFQLVNNYGPTECTVVATSGVVPSLSDTAEPPSIGRPISNVYVHVLDENLQPVAPGDPGELFIGGLGVARGYRNRPELTAERFIPNPLSFDGSDRLYRTGDLVRMLPDGQIRFLGRTDEQVKIAGYRIEPNEIVHALAKHTGVQSCCVVAREDVLGAKKLVGYIVMKPGAILTSAELRAFLQQQLPAYMLPTEFVRLERLPMLPSGKIEKNALPEPNSANQLNDTVFVAPRNLFEERMANILSGLLGLDRVSVEDNFFMLGGHSLLGTQLIGRVRDAFGVELSLRTVFDASTIAQISREIEKQLLAQLDALTDEEAQRLLDAGERGQI